ncbi:MAG: Transrane protein [Flavipsychrobacter sp.]|nr:Transrane protein [Flavipsychrobacter sp.]
MSFSDKFKQWQFSKSRLEAFSDAVFAIVITLLVLEIKVPEIEHPENTEEVLRALKGVSHVFFSWVVSFFFVALMWLHHHQIMHMATKSDYGVVWINTILLFFVTLIPFPTHLMGSYPSQPIMVALWGCTVGLTSLVLTWFYYYNTHNYLSHSFDKESVRKNVRMSILAGPLLYLLAAGLSFIDVNIAYAIYALVPVLYILPLDKEKLPGATKKGGNED